MADLTPEELRQWRSDARVGQNDASADYVEVCRRVEVLIDALEDAERGRAGLRRERDEARDALARVEALADEWASYAPSPWDEPAADLRAALRGPSDTEGQA